MFYLPIYLFLSLFFNGLQPSGIRGTISPSDAVKAMILTSATDTVKQYALAGNTFFIEARPGTYKLYIEPTSAYRPFYADNIIIEAGRWTKIGDLVLQKTTIASSNRVRNLLYATNSNSWSR